MTKALILVATLLLGFVVGTFAARRALLEALDAADAELFDYHEMLQREVNE